ncbi:hypothetical protein Kpol_541p7 [Vanderwaltozyma polyspora DSM 70294]|uniref:Rrn9 domain-containing protein n=1 Tax=Vanderwaltozyma polyspora (strain ATCC 22028 / DSM 70294 / BCRC 21397 / CBS 2163 / NBRC 10782 / NRRL Y-8283 / UCD 57-17) TaxID=436907 RepID=A7TIV2_VANPO|nr:uncharacterized protein Kpol_541p7 [Vanderwaltozyma polyspora DSM 70294]EDO17764.1 hypothetical protein Kpol_541p7 [Vanderwaltozyma polyspora DSM 70294]
MSENDNDKSIIDTANRLLDSLEQSHRSDLGLHLYSSYLLHVLLYKANEKKHMFEIDQFYRTQVKENWSSWPNPNTIIDPQTNVLYEDGDVEEKVSELKKGEVSKRAMNHASNMMKREFSSSWQKYLIESSRKSGSCLDVNELEVPTWVCEKIESKLDHLFEGLHNMVAKQKNIEIDQYVSNGQIRVSQEDSQEDVKLNKHVSFNFHDIISRGCEMGEKMDEVYMKSLRLFNDIPHSFSKSQFKISKHNLKKYKPSTEAKTDISLIFNTSREDFIQIEQLLRDKRLKANEKGKLKYLNKKNKELDTNKRTFFKVNNNNKSHKIENNEDYSINDALVKIPRT